jgi:raffinose/stachyose/melibiose transport system substrate-binding protein
MRDHHRWSTLFALLLVTSVLLMACGQSATPTAAPTSATGAQATTAPGGEATAAPTTGGQATVIIESWRSDDQKIWNEQIIPAFEASHPNIQVEFKPTAPTEYDAALSSRLQAGTAGDLITCRPFDRSLTLFKEGQLAPLNDLPGMESFSPVARSAWQTDDGATTFCVPMAAVIHGFIYNKDAFDKLGLQEPKTQEEFYQVLDKIKQDGTYTPLVMGTADQWEAATMGFQNIGPNYWKGEEGRAALLKGQAKLTDQPYLQTFQDLAKWKDYLPLGFESVKYGDAQTLFASGQGAIYPAGSWDISYFNQNAKFKLGAFPPPVAKAGDPCYISDHTDIGIGLNAKSPNTAAAQEFLSWTAGPEFATIFSNALPGFFSLSSAPVALKDPLAQEFLSWRGECKSTIRNSYQILSRGEPNLENELWRTSVGVIGGTMTPEQATTELQQGLEKWFKPQ